MLNGFKDKGYLKELRKAMTVPVSVLMKQNGMIHLLIQYRKVFQNHQMGNIYNMQYETPKALRQRIDTYIRYYNFERASFADKDQPMPFLLAAGTNCKRHLNAKNLKTKGQ